MSYLNTIYNNKRTPYTGYPKKLVAHLVNHFDLKPNMRFLEVGCGRCEHLRLFKKHELDVTGVDLADDIQTYAGDISVHTMNVETDEFPFEPQSFDVIYSKSFVEHLYYPERFFKKAYSLLKPGGKLISLVPDWETQYKTYFDDYTHRTPFTKIGLHDLYSIHNFESVSVTKFRQLPSSWRFPAINLFCALIAPFIPVRTTTPFFRWSRELMLMGVGKKS